MSLRDGREVTLRAITEADATKIVQAFERLSAESRYYRFMRYKKKPSGRRHRHRGRRAAGAQAKAMAEPCEFGITVAEDWRGIGLATWLLASLVRRARRDGYETMEGWVLAQNTSMLAVVRIRRALQRLRQ